MPIWRIEMLGRLRALGEGRQIDRFRSKQTGLLLAYLVLNHQQVHPRDELAALLLSEDDGKPLNGRFRVMLWSLRRMLEPPQLPAGSVLISDRLNVSLNTENIECDVWEFKQWLQRASLEGNIEKKRLMLQQAIALYTGPLLPGFDEEWVYPHRLHLQDAYVEALQTLTAICEQQGNFDAAIDFARKAVIAEPSLESAHCDLMRLYSRLGQSRAVLRQYKLLEQTLARELNVTPTPQAKALAAEARYKRHRSSPISLNDQSESDEASQKELVQEQEELQKPKRKLRLPYAVSRFFSRQKEIELIRSMIYDEARLITLYGAGGSGKTRLAIELGHRLTEEFEEVYFVPLADITDAKHVPQAILTAMGIPISRGVEAVEQLEEVCIQQSKPTLFILDNLENLVTPVLLQVVQRLLQSSPHIKFLVTSRRVLNLDGEREVEVAPLEVPVQAEDTVMKYRITDLLNIPSVQLFLDRARAVKPYFQLTPRNAKDVAILCTKLEGIPLAIEIAAGWVQTMTPKQIMKQLDNRLDFLVTRRKDLPERHRTLRAAVEDSVEQLTPELRELFFALSMFQGGWTVQHADELLQLSSLPHITELNERSLVFIQESQNGSEEREPITRFQMLEVIREFAIEQLPEDRLLDLAERHANLFIDLSQNTDDLNDGRAYLQLLKRIDEEQTNFQTILRRSVAYSKASDPEIARRWTLIGLRVLINLRGYWRSRVMTSEDREIYEILIASFRSLFPEHKDFSSSPEELSKLYADALIGYGAMAYYAGQYTRLREIFEEALSICEDLKNEYGIGRALTGLSHYYVAVEDNQKARNLLIKATDYFRRSDSHGWTTHTLLNLAHWYDRQAFFEKRETSFYAKEKLSVSMEALENARSVGDQLGVCVSLYTIATCYELADPKFSEYTFQALELAEECGCNHSIAFTKLQLGTSCMVLGKNAESWKWLSEALVIWARQSNPYYILLTLYRLARVANATKQYTISARLLGAAVKAAQREKLPDDLLVIQASLQKKLGKTVFDRETMSGTHANYDQIFEMIDGIFGENEEDAAVS